MKNKGHDALILIVCLPCIAFVLAITLLGILKPMMEMLGSSVYHHPDAAPYQLIPLKPSPEEKPESLIIVPANPTLAGQFSPGVQLILH